MARVVVIAAAVMATFVLVPPAAQAQQAVWSAPTTLEPNGPHGIDYQGAPRVLVLPDGDVVSLWGAHPGSWTPAATSYSYQWLRNLRPIAHATGVRYAPTPLDATTEISVAITAHRARYVNSTATTTAISVPPALRNLTPPVISGRHTPGAILAAHTGTWTPKAGTYRYRWLRNGVKIFGANGSHYRTTFTDHGRSISVTVTATRSLYLAADSTSNRLAIA